MPDFTLTTTGLNTPKFPEARAIVVERWKAAFGDNAQTASDSPDGLIIDILALLLTLAWEGVGATYANSFFATAQGVSLDLILDLFARLRLGAVASTASTVWFGDASTAVPVTSIASVEDAGTSRFATDAAATTGADGAHLACVIRVDTAVDGNTYSIDVDSVESTFVAPGGSTVQSIRLGLATALLTDNPTFTAASGGDDVLDQALMVIEATGASTISIGASQTVPADSTRFYGVRVASTAEDTGAKTALAGTLNTIETPILAIDGVCTTTDAIVGRAVEKDPAYRSRHLSILNSDGCGTPQAIRARLLDEVPTVEFARVFENETDAIDSEGRPPHSFETVYILLEGSPSADLAIATSIFGCKPAGIQAFGDIVTQVTDSQGDDHPIGHTPGTVTYLHLDVTYVPGEGFPTTGDPETAMEQATALYFQRDGDGSLELGDDFYRFAVGTPVGDTLPPPAIASITVLTDDTPAPGDSPGFTASDIIVADDAILRVDSSRINFHL